ncbi:MAG TPA: hypothetical protein VHU87_12685 [Rhizomicrobium sp.]|nr:hypothetical protein [Rhizomicrobium sp.]
MAITAIVVITVAVAGYFEGADYLQLRHQLAVEKQGIQKSVAENTEATSDLLELETQQSSITFAELFERADDRIKKLSDVIIPIEVSSLPSDEKSALKIYIKGLQETLRLQVAVYRKQLAMASALDASKAAEKDYAAASAGYDDFERKRAQQSIDDAKTALNDLKTANGDFVRQLRSFRETLQTLRGNLKDYDTLDDGLLGSVIKKEG